jgi:hypothetical protein
MRDANSFKVVHSSVRPMRVAVLVDAKETQWQDTCLRIIEYYSRLWGGAYNLIIPTDGERIDERFWGILETFDPDHLVAYRKSGRDLFLSSPDQYERTLTAQLEGFLATAGDSDPNWARGEIDRGLKQSWISGFGIAPELQREIKIRLAPFYLENWIVEAAAISAGCIPRYPLTDLPNIVLNTDHPELFGEIEVPGNEIPRLWFTAVSGSFDANMTKTLEQIGLLQDKYILGENDLHALIELTVTGAISKARAFRSSSDSLSRLDGILPYQLSMLQLGRYRSVKYAGFAEPMVLVAGNTLEDFCLYYCLSRLRDRVVWILPSITEGALASSSEEPTRVEINFVSEIQTEGMSQNSQGGLACTSYSLTEPQLDMVINRLNATGIGTLHSQIRKVADLQSLIRFPLVANERDNLQRDIPVQLANDTSLSPFPTPKPKNFHTVHPSEHRYITQLAVAQDAPPKHFHLGKWIIADHRYSTKEVRIGKEGPAYFCPNVAYFGGDIDTVLVRPRLHLPPLGKILAEIARTQGYECRPSDKGIYADESISKWGSLQEVCSYLRHENRRGLLERFLDAPKAPAELGLYLSDDRRRYLDLSAITTQTGVNAAALVDELLSKQILYRGFILRCSYCRSTSWFSVAEIGQEFKCRRCGRNQIYTQSHLTTPNEPRWFYKLDELVYQGFRHGMAVSLLALDYIRATKSDNFSFATDREFWKRGSSRPESEADFCCVIDGTLTVGEAKKENQLGSSVSEENAKIKKYLHMVRGLSARQMVFATLSEAWSDRTIRNVAQAFGSMPHVHVRFLTASELLHATDDK